MLSVVLRFASSPSAAANSFNVSSVPGAPSTIAATSVSVYAFASTSAWLALVVASLDAVEIASASAVSAYV